MSDNLPYPRSEHSNKILSGNVGALAIFGDSKTPKKIKGYSIITIGDSDEIFVLSEGGGAWPINVVSFI